MKRSHLGVLLAFLPLVGCGDLFFGTHVGTSGASAGPRLEGIAILRPTHHLRFPGSPDSILDRTAWRDGALPEDSTIGSRTGALSVWNQDSSFGAWLSLPGEFGPIEPEPASTLDIVLTDSVGIDSLWLAFPGTGLGGRANADSSGRFSIQWRVPNRRWPLALRSFRDGIATEHSVDSIDLASSTFPLDITPLLRAPSGCVATLVHFPTAISRDSAGTAICANHLVE